MDELGPVRTFGFRDCLVTTSALSPAPARRLLSSGLALKVGCGCLFSWS